MPKVIDLPTATTMDNGDYFVMEESTGGTKKITKSNALSPIGTVIEAENSAAITVANNTATSLCSISLPAGQWVVDGQVGMSGGTAAGYMAGCINTSVAIAWTYGRTASIPLTGTALAGVHLSRILQLNTTTTIYLVGYQTSGGNKTADSRACYLAAIRIA